MTRTPTSLALLLAAFVSLALAGCSRSSETASTATDTTQATDPEPRLAAISPAIAIILRDLGLADLVVARHSYDMVLPADIPDAGDQERLDYETLLRAHPTDVLMQWGARPLPERLTSLADEQGWAVLDYPLLTLDDIAECADDLWYRFGNGAPVPDSSSDAIPGLAPPSAFDPSETIAQAEANRPSARLARSWADRGPAIDRVGRVLVLASIDPPAATGPGSFHHQILERIGAIPAITEGSAWMELDAEDVLRLAPDVIVLIQPRATHDAANTDDASRFAAPKPTWNDIRERLGVLADLPIPAVQHERVMLIDDPLALTPSTAMGPLADEIADQLLEWANE